MNTPKKLCIVCNDKPARQKFCADCRRTQTLKRLALRWKSDEAYRERHKVAARLSFRRRHGIELADAE
jgi:hypothetical protein